MHSTNGNAPAKIFPIEIRESSSVAIAVYPEMPNGGVNSLISTATSVITPNQMMSMSKARICSCSFSVLQSPN